MEKATYLEFLKKRRRIDFQSYKFHFNHYYLNYSKFLPKDKNAKILDIGCGLGHFLYFCKKLGYKDVNGVDTDKELANFCRKKILSTVEKITSVVQYLSKKQDFYDFIVMNDVLEHIPKEEIIPTLNSVYNALAPKGTLVIKTPNGAWLFEGWQRYGDFTHHTSFTETSLSYILQEDGFEVDQIKFYAEKYVVDSFKQLLRHFFRELLTLFFKILFKIEKMYSPQIFSAVIIAVVRKE